MNAQELIDELKSKDIILKFDGTHLIWTPPVEIVPEKQVEELVRQHYDEIIERIGIRPAQWFKGKPNRLFQGDCLKVMDMIPTGFVDLIVTDPPYGLEFMGKDWDKVVPSIEVWKECFRVLKPGGFAFIVSSPRQDVLSKMIFNIQDAGFKTDYTSLYWTYATGFPKAQNIGKAVDKKFGAEREVVEERKQHDIRNNGYGTKKTEFIEKILGDPVTPEAKKLEGSYAGFQPKPAVEVILVVMKPLIEKGYTDQALDNGKGISLLDDCRLPYPDEDTPSAGDHTGKSGRFPANLLISDDVLDDGNLKNGDGRVIKKQAESGTYSRFFSLDAWAEKNKPFLIVPKPSQAEKEFGLDDILGQQVDKTKKDSDASDSDNPKNSGGKERKNFHPTVKPILLMSYLITLGSREGDIILDPFCGSGTTCLSARLLKRGSIGIDKNPEYYEMAKKRLRALTLASYYQAGSEEKSIKEKCAEQLAPAKKDIPTKRKAPLVVLQGGINF